MEYTLCTEYGSRDFTDRDKAIKEFERLEAKGTECALYEGDNLIRKTGIELTGSLI